MLEVGTLEQSIATPSQVAFILNIWLICAVAALSFVLYKTMRPEKNNNHDKNLLNDSALYSQPQEEDSFNMLYSEAEEVS